MENPQDEPQSLQTVYQELEDLSYDVEEASRAKKANDYLNVVQNYLPTPGRILDIGCASGIFLSTAHAAGWQVSGLEPSSWALIKARSRCPHAMLYSGSIGEAPIIESSYEAITLWDVLEHVPSPDEALKAAYRWLSPGGFIFLNLPNIESMTARFMRTRWVLLLREHLWYFSPHTIQLLLEKTGFTLVSVTSNKVWFSLGNIAQRLGQYPGPAGAVFRSMSEVKWLRSLTVRFPMGEMNVVAQK